MGDARGWPRALRGAGARIGRGTTWHFGGTELVAKAGSQSCVWELDGMVGSRGNKGSWGCGAAGRSPLPLHALTRARPRNLHGSNPRATPGSPRSQARTCSPVPRPSDLEHQAPRRRTGAFLPAHQSHLGRFEASACSPVTPSIAARGLAGQRSLAPSDPASTTATSNR
jgi:hypothetical protein